MSEPMCTSSNNDADSERARLLELARDLPPEAISHLSWLLEMAKRGEQMTKPALAVAFRLDKLEGLVASHYHPGFREQIEAEEAKRIDLASVVCDQSNSIARLELEVAKLKQSFSDYLSSVIRAKL